MFTKSFLLAAAASLAIGFGAHAADAYYFSAPEDDAGRQDLVDLPSLASGYSDPLPRDQELDFARAEDDHGRADVVDQPSLAKGFADPLPRSQELELARPLSD